MIIDITRLNNGVTSEIEFNFNYVFTNEELQKADILKTNNFNIKGNITVDSLHDYNIEINIVGIVFLPCSLTLNEVEYPINIKIDQNLDEIMIELDKNYKKGQNTLDIFPIVWENILMEIPMKVISKEKSEIKLSGDGWKLITEEEDQIKVNPELEKLKDLL
ncbi:MAG: DUF177 domain-containing protein [Bacilli bacterium]|nr:DUF177 domain-containing protein [Bacilli bacterium]